MCLGSLNHEIGVLSSELAGIVPERLVPAKPDFQRSPCDAKDSGGFREAAMRDYKRPANVGI